MRFSIFLIYYNRPQLVKNALRSILALDYQDFDVLAIDDGSESSLSEVLADPEFASIVPKIEIYRCDDTAEDKAKRGYSRLGQYMNLAIQLSTGDIGITLCDDDALVSDYLTNLDRWFEEHPDKMYCYSHLIDFNPRTETPSIDLPKKGLTNITEAVDGYCKLDGSQMAWWLEVSREDGGVRFPELRTDSLDAFFYRDMFTRYGPCVFCGFYGQYKGRFAGQLSNRLNEPYKYSE